MCWRFTDPNAFASIGASDINVLSEHIYVDLTHRNFDFQLPFLYCTRLFLHPKCEV